MVQPGLSQRLDQLDLIRSADRAGLDLKPFARAFLVDVYMCRQIGHGLVPLSERDRLQRLGVSVRKPVEARRGAGEEIGFFRPGGAARKPFERVEQHRIAARALVDRKVAFEHAAVGAETLDAGIDIGPPGIGHLLR